MLSVLIHVHTLAQLTVATQEVITFRFIDMNVPCRWLQITVFKTHYLVPMVGQSLALCTQ